MTNKKIFIYVCLFLLGMATSSHAKTVKHIYPEDSIKAEQFSSNLAAKIQESIADLVVVSLIKVKSKIQVVEEWEGAFNDSTSDINASDKSTQGEQRTYRFNNSILLNLERQIEELTEQKIELTDVTLLTVLEQQLIDTKKQYRKIKELVDAYKAKYGLKKKLSEKVEILHLDVVAIVDVEGGGGEHLVTVRNKIIETANIRFEKGDTLQIENFPSNSVVEPKKGFNPKTLEQVSLSESKQLISIDSTNNTIVDSSKNFVAVEQTGQSLQGFKSPDDSNNSVELKSNEYVAERDNEIIEDLLSTYLENFFSIDPYWFQYLLAHWIWLTGGLILILYLLIMLFMLRSKKKRASVDDDSKNEKPKVESVPKVAYSNSTEQERVAFKPTVSNSTEQERVAFKPTVPSSTEQEGVAFKPTVSNSTEQERVAFKPTVSNSTEQERVAFKPTVPSSTEQEGVAFKPTVSNSTEQEGVAFEPTVSPSFQVNPPPKTAAVSEENTRTILHSINVNENTPFSQDMLSRNDIQTTDMKDASKVEGTLDVEDIQEFEGTPRIENTLEESAKEEYETDINESMYLTLDTHTLNQLLEDEDLETRTLVVARLEPDKAARLLTTFTSKKQGELISSIASVKEIDENYCHELDERLNKKIKSMLEENHITQMGLSIASEMISMLASKDVEAVLESIRQNNPQLYNQLLERYQKPHENENDDFFDFSHLKF